MIQALSEVLKKLINKVGHEIESALKVILQANYIITTISTINACKGAKVTVKEDKLSFKIGEASNKNHLKGGFLKHETN